MSKSIGHAPPGKVLRLGLQLPILLYRLRLGSLVGERFLRLTHTGRRSELRRQTVIEVVGHDKNTDAYFVVSGWVKSRIGIKISAGPHL